MGWEIETLEGIFSTESGGVYNVISREAVEKLLADEEALKLLAEHGYEVKPYVNDLGEVVGHVIRTASSSNGTSTAVSNTVDVLVKNTTVDDAMIEGVANGSIGTASDVGALTAGETVSQVSVTGGGTAVGGTALSTVAGPAIAVGLGVGLGVVLYNISPDFWDGVSDKLVKAGKTIGGKVLTFFDKDGKNYYDEETINIIKQALLDKGYLVDNPEEKYTLSDDLATDFNIKNSNSYKEIKQPVLSHENPIIQRMEYYYNDYFIWQPENNNVISACFKDNNYLDLIFVSTNNFTVNEYRSSNGTISGTPYKFSSSRYTQNNKTFYMAKRQSSISQIGKWPLPTPINTVENTGYSDFEKVVAIIILYGELSSSGTKPKPLPTEGTKKIPSGNPTDKDDDKDKKVVYPFPLPADYPSPDDNPDPSYDPTDSNDPDPTPSDKDRDNPKKDPNDRPEGEPEDNPAPNPDPNKPTQDDPIVDKPTDPPDPNPPRNPDGGNVPDPPFPIVPDAGLGNIYNPSRAEIASLQSYLWSANNLVDILKLFQNPLDGIISLHWIFGTPTIGGNREITLGYLPTGVQAPIVTNQFIDIDCGTISIPLRQKNALDYPPYTDIQIYLPFIGIHPLNAYDMVGGTINVSYRIDVYTGACVAKLTVNRGGMSAKLYEFSGNCGYELPLTSGNFVGFVGNVISGAFFGGIAGGVAGAALGGLSSAIHSNLNVTRSGNLSANAGICGSRKPYIIITRAVPYDSANYNQFYGYPSNKTVYISNCKGYTRVKSIILHTSATDEEKKEIESLLKEGVYL